MQNPFIAEIVSRLAAVTDLPEAEIADGLSTPPDPKMGDVAFACFVLSKRSGRKPNEIADDLAAQIPARGVIREGRAVGPYLNFFYRQTPFITWVLRAAHKEKERFGSSDAGRGRTVVIEYSSPNIAKHLAIHHVRTTMIGHALDRIHRALGYHVVGINFLGDWGTQFGILIAAYRRWGGPETLEGDPVANLNRLYVRFNEDTQSDPTLKEEGREWFRRLEQGDEEAVALWKKFREVSLAAFDRVYERLGVTFDVVSGESQYENEMPETIARLKEAGLAKEDAGALIVELKAYKMPPVMLRKSDGATTYHTRDLAAAQARWEQYRFARMIYVVGGDQKLHFRQVFKTLELMGCSWAGLCTHVDFGIIRMKGDAGSAKMSTRGGRIVMLKDVLDEAVARVRKAIEEKNPDLADKDAVAEAVGVGAVIFNDLKRQRTKDVDFDWNNVLSFEGETGPYVQYAHVRLCSILRKYGRPVSDTADFALLTEPEEFDLAKALAGFNAVLRRAAESCEPCVVAQYLLDLCTRFSSYYHKHVVVGDDPELTAARIALVDALRRTIANGLRLLGIGAPEEM